MIFSLWHLRFQRKSARKSFFLNEQHIHAENAPMILKRMAVLVVVLSLNSFGEAEEYILQPGDGISINVVEHPEFSGRHKIRPDGRINYPVIGELDVASMSCAQLVKIMQGKLAPYVNNPVVSVSIDTYYANKIFIIGDVNRSGEYEIYEPIEVIKAIAMCGGLQNTKVKWAKIIKGDGTVVTVNLHDLFEGSMTKRESAKYLLYPGDTMFVPDSMKVNWGLIASILTVISISLQIAVYSMRLNS
jgi:polysaccharide export outer membrane protein